MVKILMRTVMFSLVSFLLISCANSTSMEFEPKFTFEQLETIILENSHDEKMRITTSDYDHYVYSNANGEGILYHLDENYIGLSGSRQVDQFIAMFEIKLYPDFEYEIIYNDFVNNSLSHFKSKISRLDGVISCEYNGKACDESRLKDLMDDMERKVNNLMPLLVGDNINIFDYGYGLKRNSVEK